VVDVEGIESIGYVMCGSGGADRTCPTAIVGATGVRTEIIRTANG